MRPVRSAKSENCTTTVSDVYLRVKSSFSLYFRYLTASVVQHSKNGRVLIHSQINEFVPVVFTAWLLYKLRKILYDAFSDSTSGSIEYGRNSVSLIHAAMGEFQLTAYLSQQGQPFKLLSTQVAPALPH